MKTLFNMIDPIRVKTIGKTRSEIDKLIAIETAIIEKTCNIKRENMEIWEYPGYFEIKLLK